VNEEREFQLNRQFLERIERLKSSGESDAEQEVESKRIHEDVYVARRTFAQHVHRAQHGAPQGAQAVPAGAAVPSWRLSEVMNQLNIP
jgi:hypothetical protein